jgi:hypothetical protein
MSFADGVEADEQDRCGLSASWAIYDRLLEEIPGDVTLAACLVGRSWTVVDSGWMGVALTYRGDSKGSALGPPHAGRRLSDTAAHLKSWNLHEASLRMAGINSYYNTRGAAGGTAARATRG